MVQNDYFSIYELYYLISSFDGKVLLGLPRLEELDLTTEDIWETAKETLYSKKLITKNSDLTELGLFVVEALRSYCTGSDLIILNNFYVMLSENKRDSVLLVHSEKGYQIRQLGPIGRLKLLQEKIPMVLREPLEDEKSFLTREETLTSLFEEILVNEETLIVHHYPLNKMLDREIRDSGISAWFFRVYEDKLYGFDTRQEKLYRLSQYYFLERLYIWCGIPFREEDFQ